MAGRGVFLENWSGQKWSFLASEDKALDVTSYAAEIDGEKTEAAGTPAHDPKRGRDFLA